MTHARLHRQRLIGLLALAGVSVAVAGCGLGAGNSAPPETLKPKKKKPSQAQQAKTAAVQQRQAITKAFRSLPQPQPGNVTVAGGAALGITSRVINAYKFAKPGSSVGFDQTSSSEAFHLLCTGRADIAESTQPPSASELQECAENGITFKTDANGNPVPIVLAADGIVVATKNQADVGGDCLKRTTVRQIFGAGSTINNWAQLGFFNIPLHTTGREPNTDVFQIFANLVLGTQGQASLADVRSDYRAEPSDADVKELVTGQKRLDALLKAEHKQIAKALKDAKPKLKQAEVIAENNANKRVLLQIAAANKALAKTKKVLTKAQKKAIAQANLQLDTNAKIEAQAAADQNIVAGIKRRVDGFYASRIAAASNPGSIGVFRYTYYELYEQELRPMEIWDPITTISQLQDEGVAVDQSTAAEIKTTYQREQAGGGLGQVTQYTFPYTPTKPGASYPAAGGVTLTVPGTGPINVNKIPNCIFPSRQTITSGVYPLSVRLLAYVPSYRIKRPEVTQYLGYYLGTGQNTVQQDRLVPLDQTVRAKEYKAVTGQNLPQSLLTTGAVPLGTVGTGAAGGTSTNPSGTSTTGTSTNGASTAPGNSSLSQSSGIG